MDYNDIIKDNCRNHSQVSWWPMFAYHCTDVTNAVSILDSEMLYSRTTALQKGAMSNDNASRQVIDMTDSGATSSVRFYFRPLTPTQYYNEGYKHPQLRYDNDINANMPVPVFFVFDLAYLLSIPTVMFSEQPQSGHGAALQNGFEAFSKLPFDKIYSNGYNDIEVVKKYRHAEILHPNFLPLDSGLRNILCRNNIERNTLLNILREQNFKNYKKYQGIIKTCRREMFENNGLYVTDVIYHESILSFSFSDTVAKRNYTKRMIEKNCVTELKPVSVRFVIDWLNGKSTINRIYFDAQIDYCSYPSVRYRLPPVPGAKKIRIQIFFDDSLMCSAEQSLEESELIK